MPDAAKKTCFVIAPIGKDGSDTRQRSDLILEFVITPAVKECGYDEVIRADQISEPGIITTQVIQHIFDDELVIADLTGQNPNVYYELAVRHAAKKPYVQLIQAGETIPFDVAGIRTISVDHNNLRSVEDCKKEIIKHVRHVEQNPNEVDSPISVSIDLQSLKQSENPVEKMTAEIVDMLQNFQFSIDEKLDQRLSRMENVLHKTRRSTRIWSINEMKNMGEEFNALSQAIVESRRQDDLLDTQNNIKDIQGRAFRLGEHLLDLLSWGDYPKDLLSLLEYSLIPLQS